jgi:hypothetical protein
MFIVESKSDRAVRKMSRLMFFVMLLLSRTFGPVLTMHFYVEPRPPEPPGWRIDLKALPFGIGWLCLVLGSWLVISNGHFPK